MTVLKEHQFEILPSAEASDGFVFGIGADVSLDEAGFDPGETEWLTQDSQNTRRGNAAFGRDVLGSKFWVWDSHVNAIDVSSAIDTLELFHDAWTPEELVRSPGEVTALRYQINGRTRRIFGRPRRFSAPPSNTILNGHIPVTHEFALVDTYTYDDLESSASIGYASSVSGGGFVLPAVMPITTIPSLGNGSDQIVVGGTSRAYPVIRFTGPWVNPSIDIGDWKLTWSGSIGPNSWVEIDARPWKLTVLDQSGASAVEGLDRRVRLEDVWFAPRTQPQISLGGSAPGGNAVCTVRWRSTWKSL